MPPVAVAAHGTHSRAGATSGKRARPASSVRAYIPTKYEAVKASAPSARAFLWATPLENRGCLGRGMRARTARERIYEQPALHVITTRDCLGPP